MAGRQKPRYLVQKEVTINGDIKANCFDLNEEGMYIQTENPFGPNNVLNLSFDVDGSPVKVKATVRHLDPGFGFGVRFITLSAEDKVTISRALAALEQPQEYTTVLLVDKDERCRTVYKYALQQEGFKVLDMASGNDAFKILQQTPPDAVIVDNQIEGINAFKILQFMQTKEELKTIPAIMLTTRFIPDEADKVQSLGVRDYLIKFKTTPKSLADKVKLFLGE